MACNPESTAVIGLLCLLASGVPAHGATLVGSGSGPEPVTIINDSVAASVLEVASIDLADPTHFSLVSGGSCNTVPFTLNGGESCTLWVEFVPQSEGFHETSLRIAADAGSVLNDLVALSGRGVEGPTPNLAPELLSFGLVDAASLPATDSLALSNIGDATVSFNVTGLFLSGDAEFSIDSNTCEGATLFGGDSCTVDIAFDASSDGSFNSQLTAQTTAGDIAAQIQGTTRIPDRVVFLEQPTTAIVNQVIKPAIVVQVQDSTGTVVSLDNDTVVDLSLAVDPTGQAGLGGVVSVQVSNGEAVFDDLSTDQVGSGFVLQAADSGGQLTVDHSLPFSVLPGEPAVLLFSVQPSATEVATVMTPAVQVQVLDNFGNLVDWDDTTEIELALSGGHPEANLDGGRAQVVSGGVATFAGLSVDQAATENVLIASAAPGSITGAVSAPFEITAAVSTTAITGIDPTNSQAIGEPYVVSVSVGGQNPTGTVLVSDGVGATCSIDLPESSCSLVSTSVGSRTISANYSGDTNNDPSAATSSYDIIAAEASIDIVAVDPPDSQQVNQAYTLSVAVSGADPVGTVAIDDGAGGSCQLVLPSSSCQLTSTAIGAKTLTAVYSGDSNNSGAQTTTSYEITAGPAAALEFVVQPTSTTSGSAIEPAVEVRILDAFGNPVLDDNSTQVKLTLIDGASGAVLDGGDATTVHAGVAVFDALVIDLAGKGYRLHVTAVELSDATSVFFDVGAGPAAQLSFGVQPSTTLVGEPISPAVAVRVEDAAGNRVVSDQSTSIELQLEGGPADANLSSAGPFAAVDGLVEFSSLSIDLVGVGYLIQALDTDGLLTGAVSTDFNIAGASSNTEITGLSPSTSQTVGESYSVSVSVTGAAPTGTVTVTDGAGASCQIELPAAACSLTSSVFGPKVITAAYAGDINNASSSDTANYRIDPVQSQTSIDIVSPPGEQTVNQFIVIFASINGFQPTGNISIDGGAGAGCDIVLPSSSCQYRPTSVGERTLAASYAGDVNNLGSSATESYEIVKAASSTVIAGVTPPGQQVVAVPYQVTAIVSGDTPTGWLQVQDDIGASCKINLDQGQTSCQLASTQLGQRILTASYPGDTTNEASSDSTAYQIVSSGPAALRFASEPARAGVNGPLLPRVVVQVVDTQGLPVTADDTTEIEVRFEVNPTDANLSGALLGTAENGQVHFNNLSIDQVGIGYRLRARTPNLDLEPAVSGPFDVFPDQLFNDNFEAPQDLLFRDRFEVMPPEL